MREVRLLFSKTDRCKYISHLDINRCMSRALTRAKIPLWYTEGFNPNQYSSAKGLDYGFKKRQTRAQKSFERSKYQTAYRSIRHFRAR